MSSRSSIEDSDGEPLPRVLPRLLPAERQATEQRAPDPKSSLLVPRAKRTHVVPAACEACRRRKSKCSAQRPRCLACVQRDTECRYTTASEETHAQALKRKYDELQIRYGAQTPYEELYHILQSKPAPESLDIYHRLRAGADIEAILRHVKDGDLLMQLTLVPETGRQYEFPYHPEMPDFILATRNQYLNSVIYDATVTSQTASESPEQMRHARSVRYLCPYLKPFRAANIMDELLSQVEVAKWTRAMSQERILKKLLHDYLLYQHPWTMFFHKDHFLEDMKSGHNRFCSQLLVNAVLASACHISREAPHRARFWDPQNLGYRFLAEAKQLWELELSHEPARLTTIQAGLLLSAISNMNGTDRIGNYYLENTIKLAEEDNLFQPAGHLKDKRMRHSRALTAWSIFAWQALHAYQLLRPPWIVEAPAFELPQSVEDGRYFGEIEFSYPPSHVVHPLQLGRTISAHFSFCQILNSLALLLFKPKSVPLSIEQVFEFKEGLDKWYSEMPETLRPVALTFPHHILLHMEYHGLMIRLMQLLNGTDSPSLEQTVTDRIAHRVIKESEILLETLVRLYYLRHSFDDCSPRLMNWLIFLGNTAVERLKTRTNTSSSSSSRDNSDSPERPAEEPTTRALRSTIVLCALGLYSQGQNYQLAVLVFRALRDRMARADVDLLQTYITARDDDGTAEQPLMPQYLQSEWPLPIIKLNEDRKSSSLERLIGKYATMSLGTISGEHDS